MPALWLFLCSFFFSILPVLQEDTAKRFIGQKPPEIESRDWFNSPKSVQLKDFEGRLIFLEFWASYSKPSIDAISTLNTFHKRYGPQGLVVLSLTDESKAVVDQAVKQHSISYRVGASSKTGTSYNVTNFPYAYLIASDGLVVWQGSPVRDEDEIEKTIQKYLRWVQYFALDREVVSKLSTAVSLAEKNDFGRALKEVSKFLEDPEPKVSSDAKYLSDKLLAVAKRSNDLADSLFKEGKYFEASETLNQLVKRFAGHEISANADKKIKEWQADPKISGEIEAYKALDKANTYYNQRKLVQAKQAFEAFIKKFPHHPDIKDAEAHLDEVNGWMNSCFCGSGKTYNRCHGKQ